MGIKMYHLKVNNHKNIFYINDRLKSEELQLTLLFFFLACIIGWLWEVVFIWINNGILVNRGILHGPWLPIYGCGGILMVILKKSIGHKPFYFIAGSIVSSGLLEYITSWLLETIFHARWWDYSNQPFNLQGRICIKYLIFFAVVGSIAVFVVKPLFDKLLLYFPTKIRKYLCIGLSIMFLIDLVYSFLFPDIGVGISTLI
ncbi:MAG: putative ABC transporter permease [Lachnotalea sp.]